MKIIDKAIVTCIRNVDKRLGNIKNIYISFLFRMSKKFSGNWKNREENKSVN